MPFQFEWRDSSRRAMVYRAAGDWNWRDYHQAVRASIFSIMTVSGPVDSVIDLRGSQRSRLPAGLQAHVRSFGRRHQAQLSGRAVVIGLPRADVDGLLLAGDGSLSTADGLVQFVDDESDLDALLRDWSARPPSG